MAWAFRRLENKPTAKHEVAQNMAHDGYDQYSNVEGHNSQHDQISHPNPDPMQKGPRQPVGFWVP